MPDKNVLRATITLALRLMVAGLAILASTSQASPLNVLTSKLNTNMSDLPRYEKLPLFNPHRKTFTCVYQDQHVPPIEPQAELWFQQALALDDPNIYPENRDYPKIYQLYMQAAERNHWKAMLNLASLILSDNSSVPEHNPEVAIRWVETAMRLGVPDAYDMMGVYHQNGLVKGGDATSAYAFFQRAADMGSPAAMTFLGDKLAATYDDPSQGFWGNIPVATEMLQCALAQGYGDAAEALGYLYKGTTPESKLRALKVFHEGVKLGSAKCANALYSEFDGMNLTNGRNIVGHIDKARAERYSKLGDALEFYGGRLKLPNLDKVLPLPPAPLPKWDGEKKTLIDGAKAVTAPPTKSQQGASLQGRELFLTQMIDAGLLRQVPGLASPIRCNGAQRCPRTGIWEGRVAGDHPLAGLYNRWDRQAFIEKDRAFPIPADQFIDIAAVDLKWTYLGNANEETGVPGIFNIGL